MLQPSPSDQPPEAGTADARAQRTPKAHVELDPTWRAGKKLEEARKQLGLSLQEVSDRIRVRREFLEALETMNVKLLPGKAYALAFLRSYAQVLGLKPDEIVEQFQAESALTREDAQKQIRNPASKPHPERPWLAALALVLIAVGFVGWRAIADRKPADDAATAQGGGSVLAPAQIAPQPAAADGAERRVIEIRAVAAGWLEARGPDGTVFLSRTMQPGEVYRPDSSPGWTLHARDGAAFETYVNGVDAGPLGPAGKPVLGRAIDEIQPVTQAALNTPGG
ncbi:MAG TPA: RodZ domain-containing protein [Caulobacterales bacterium]|nr:RodZ domain-containing protein [Caulobacterales bacterium]